jgi:hypothetical protein
MSSSDSDSEDENIALLREAADTSLISDDMFNKCEFLAKTTAYYLTLI